MGMIMKLTVDDHYFEIQDDLLIRSCRSLISSALCRTR